MNKISLQHVDIIISFRASTQERLDNLLILLRHFDVTYSDYRVLIIEGDESSKWVKQVDERIVHHFVYAPGVFPKSLLYNTGVKLARSEVIIIHDCDLIIKPETMLNALNGVMQDANLAFESFSEIIEVSGEAKARFALEPTYQQLREVERHNLPENYKVISQDSVGGVTIMNRQKVKDVGGYNTHIVGLGSDDGAFYARCKSSGLTWLAIDGPAFYLHHDTESLNEWRVSEQAQFNLAIERKAIGKSDEDKPIFHVTIMTAQDVFYECKAWCMHALAAAGYEVTYADAQLRPDAINIVLGSYCTADTWTSLSQQASRIIIYNWEPAASDHGRFTQRYVRSLQHAHVWDYSRNNVTELKEFAGVQDIHYVPMGYVPSMTRIRPAAVQDVDVLFYGTMYPRRQMVVDQLREKGLRVVTSDDFSGNLTGEQRDELISKSKVVLNMHAFDGVHVFEMARMSYLLANSKAVVAEVSERTDIDDDLREAVRHGSIEELAQLCYALVHDDVARAQLEQNALNSFSKRDAASIMQAAVNRYLSQGAELGNKQALSLTFPRVLQLGSGSIALGFNERWNYLRCNIDARADFAPDIQIDLDEPLDFSRVYLGTRFGDVQLTPGCFSEIDAQYYFHRSRHLLVALTNCLNLLEEGGLLKIPTLLDLGHQSWSHVHEKRAFNEQTWQLMMQDWWQYGWQTHRFEAVNVIKSVDSDFGYQILVNNGGDWDSAMKIPRAIDKQIIALRKRALTEDEKSQLESIIS